MRRMKQIKSTVEENNEAFIARIMEEMRSAFKAEQQGITNSGFVKHQSQNSNDFLAKLMENRNILSEIDAKVEKISNAEELASKVQNLVLSRSVGGVDNSEKFLKLDRHIQDLTWWSKASLIVSITSSACLMFYVFSR